MDTIFLLAKSLVIDKLCCDMEEQSCDMFISSTGINSYLQLSLINFFMYYIVPQIGIVVVYQYQ